MTLSIDYLKQEIKRQLLPGCGTFVASCELALKAIRLADSLSEENKQLKKRVEAENGFAVKAGVMIDELQVQLEFLTNGEARKELAELRKAPGMEEVDAILQSDQTPEACEEALASLARKAIESREVEKKRADAWQEKYEDENSERLMVEKERDDIAGLLKWLATSKVDGLSVMATLMAKSHYGNTDAHRVLEIVEGK